MSHSPRILVAFTTLVAGSFSATCAHQQSSRPPSALSGASATAPDVDLLHAVPTTLIVGSCDSRYCNPAALVDNNPASIWGTLGQRTVIIVRVPPSVRVSGVRVTVGAPGAAFESGPRATTLRVSLGAQTVGDFDLHPMERGPQWVPFNVHGGDLKLVFDNYLPNIPRYPPTYPEPVHFVSQIEVRGTASGGSAAASPSFEIGVHASGDPAAIEQLQQTMENALGSTPMSLPDPCPCRAAADRSTTYPAWDETVCREFQDVVYAFLNARAALVREMCGSNPFAVDNLAEFNCRAADYLHPFRRSAETRDETVLRGDNLYAMQSELFRALSVCPGHPESLDSGDLYCE